jgi:hypothetical protein
LLERLSWSTTLQALVLLSALLCLPAALLARAPAAVNPQVRSPHDSSILAALAEPAIQRFLLVLALEGLANSALLLNQVPAIQAAGLSIGAAAWFAGTRGLFQIPGRLFLKPLTSRLGVRGAMFACYAGALTAVLALLLALTGAPTVLCVVYFTAFGGMALGMLSPLHGLFQSEVYGNANLGALSGVSVLVASLSAAGGTFLSGVILGLSDSYVAVLALVAGCQLVALFVFVWQGRARARHRDVAMTIDLSSKTAGGAV